MAKEFMLSTVDNPFDPFKNFDEWYAYDTMHAVDRRDCCGLLAKFSYTYPDMSEKDFNEEIERAIDEIIKYDPLHIYIKCTKETPEEADEDPVD